MNIFDKLENEKKILSKGDFRQSVLKKFGERSFFEIFKRFYINNDMDSAKKFVNLIGNNRSILNTGEVFKEIQKERKIENKCSTNTNHFKILNSDFLNFVKESTNLNNEQFNLFVLQNKIYFEKRLPVNDIGLNIELMHTIQKNGGIIYHKNISDIAKKAGNVKNKCSTETVRKLADMTKKHAELQNHKNYTYPDLSLYEIIGLFLWKAANHENYCAFLSILDNHCKEENFFEKAIYFRIPVVHLKAILEVMKAQEFNNDKVVDLFKNKVFFNISCADDFIELLNYGFGQVKEENVNPKERWIYPLFLKNQNDFPFLVNENKSDIISKIFEYGLNISIKTLNLYKEEIAYYLKDEEIIKQADILLEKKLLTEAEYTYNNNLKKIRI